MSLPMLIAKPFLFKKYQFTPTSLGCLLWLKIWYFIEIFTEKAYKVFETIHKF